MNIKKQISYKKSRVLLAMVLGFVLLNTSLLLSFFVNINHYALPKLIISSTLISLPFHAAFSFISATSFVYLLEKFPRLQVVTVSLFIISYLEYFLDFKVVKIAAPLVSFVSIIIFCRLKTTVVNTFILLVFFSGSIISFILQLKPVYDNALFSFSKSAFYVEETMDSIVYQAPKDYFDKIRKVHEKLPESYKLLDTQVRVLESGTISSWMREHISKEIPSSISGSASYKVWGKNIVFVELASDELQLEKILVHELTHIKQFERYGLRFFFQPQWKMEGQAVIAENCFSQEEIRSFLAKDLNLHPFKYKFLGYGVDDYKASQAQAWYSLKYLKLSEDEFFDSKTKLAPWDEVKKAFLEYADS